MSLTICPALGPRLGMLIFSGGLLGGGVTACRCGDTEFRPVFVSPGEGEANEPSFP